MPVADDFAYRSDTNDLWLTVDDLRSMLEARWAMMLPYGRQSISEAEIDAVAEVLRGDWLTTGPAVEAFDADAVRVGRWPECVAVTSGTAALHVAYAACGVGPGDEVRHDADDVRGDRGDRGAARGDRRVRRCRAGHRLCSTRPRSAARHRARKVIAAVDYAGHPADYDALREPSPRDRCAPAGRRRALDRLDLSGRPIGSTADITTFSFFPTKNLTTAEGGAVASPHAGLATRPRAVSQPRPDARPRNGSDHRTRAAGTRRCTSSGSTTACPTCSARSACVSFSGWRLHARRASSSRATTSCSATSTALATPVQRPDVDPAWHLYAMRVLDGRRREVYDALRAAGIGVQVNYIPAYWHPVFADLGYRRGMCPNAEAFYRRAVAAALPRPDRHDQDHVIDALRTALAS